FAPLVSVSDNKNINGETGQLILTGFEPKVETPVIVTPEMGQLLLTGFAPFVTIGASKVIIIGSGQLLLTGFVPTVVITINPTPHDIPSEGGGDFKEEIY